MATSKKVVSTENRPAAIVLPSNRFLNDIREILQQARRKAYATSNFIMVEAYWKIADISVTVKLRVKVTLGAFLEPTLVIVDSEVIDGKIQDLFDWDLDVIIKGIPTFMFPSLGPLARGGAQLQAAHLGKGSSRSGGMVFMNIYRFGKKQFAGFSFQP